MDIQAWLWFAAATSAAGWFGVEFGNRNSTENKTGTSSVLMIIGAAALLFTTKESISTRVLLVASLALFFIAGWLVSELWNKRK